MRCITPAAALLMIVVPITTVLAAGVPLPAGPLPIDPGFGNNVTYTRTLHVATTGNDSSGNGQQATPYATLNKTLSVATPGTMIIMHQGTYTGYLAATNLQGTASAPILVTTAAGEGPVILDRMSGGVEVMHLTDAAYVIFENLTFRGSTDNAINCDDGGSYATPAHHIIFRNLTIEDAGSGGNNDGIKLSGVDYIYVLGCLIQRIRSGSGIDMVGCHHSVIAYNYFYNLIENGTQTKGGSEDVLILGNLFVEAGQRAMNMGGNTDLGLFRPVTATFEAKNIRAIGNVIKDTQAPVAYVGLVNGLAANNTIYMPSYYVIRILQETTSKDACQNGKFINNIIYFRTTDLNGGVNVGSNTLPNTFTFANNLWYAVNNPNFGGYSLPTPETNGIYKKDPLFTQLGDAQYTQVNDDFRLRRASPARGKGQSLAGLELASMAESDRVARRYMATPTLGAYELGLDADVDGDGTVSVADLQLLVTAWASQKAPPSANWNVYADANDDGYVNVGDLQLMVANWGTHSP